MASVDSICPPDLGPTDVEVHQVVELECGFQQPGFGLLAMLCQDNFVSWVMSLSRGDFTQWVLTPTIRLLLPRSSSTDSTNLRLSHTGGQLCPVS